MKQEKQCEHRSFQAVKNGWQCQWCLKIFSAQEVERIMIASRQRFAELEE